MLFQHRVNTRTYAAEFFWFIHECCSHAAVNREPFRTSTVQINCRYILSARESDNNQVSPISQVDALFLLHLFLDYTLASALQ